MKKYIFILLCLLSFYPVFGKGPTKKINCNFNNIPFSLFCESILQQTGVKIYYKDEWTSKINVTIQKDSISVAEAVQLALTNTNLKVSVWNNNIVLLPGELLLSNLPEYNLELKTNYNLKQKTIGEKEDLYLKGRKADTLSNFTIGKKELMNMQSKVKILIRLISKESGEPIIGGTAYIEELKTGATSNTNGFITLTLAPGNYNVKFEFLGMEKAEHTLHVYSDGEMTVRLDKSMIEINEVQVYGDYQKNIKLKEAGIEKLTAREIKEIPTMLGEKDILKFSQMLPGIVSSGENSSGINVRGGNSDQNGFYINKIPVFNTSHLFGFFSAFNSDIVKDFSIYKGYIPAQFGGNLSSIFNIITRNGNRRNFRMHGGINPISTNMVIEGPIIRDTLSYLFSGRTSYSDWILKKIPDPDIRNSKANFNDFSFALNYDLSKTRYSLFLYNSNDRFKFSNQTDYDYHNLGGALNINKNLSNFLQMDLAVVYSRYGFNTIEKSDASLAYQHSYNITHNEAKIDFKHFVNFKHSLEYGAGVILYELNRGDIMPYGAESARQIKSLGKEKGAESSVYITDIINLSSWLSVTLGGRYSIYAPLGERTIYNYKPNSIKTDNTIIDSVYYKPNKVIKWFHSPELRALVNISINNRSSVKLSFNQTHQNLFMLNNTIAISPNTQWKLSDNYLQPSYSTQYSTGYFQNFRQGWEISAEIFYKTTRNYTEFKDGADFLNSKKLEQIVLQGNQNAYGVEFLVKRSRNKLNGWISYTYSRAKVQVKSNIPGNSINGGEFYPASYDIPHVVNALINYKIRRRINFSTVFSYQTGKPITYPTSIFYLNGVQYTQYSKRNEYRIPDYYRIDASVTLEGNLKREKLLHSSWMLSVYNLTGRKNPYSVFFKTENKTIKSYKYSVIGVPVFTVTWLIKLGNYATE